MLTACRAVHCALCMCLQALRSRRLLYTSGGGGPKGVRRGSMHSMLTLQLDSFEADGTPLQRNTLSFVELAAPEPKVGGVIDGRTGWVWSNNCFSSCCCLTRLSLSC